MRAGSFSPPGKDHLCATFILIKMAEDSQKELQWSDDRVLDLIYEIEQLPLLWDPRDKEKKNRNKKNDAFKSLADKFGITAEEIRKKYLNLFQARNCRRKIKNSKLSGAGTSSVYKPAWFAYEALHKFMENVYTPHGVTETMVSTFFQEFISIIIDKN